MVIRAGKFSKISIASFFIHKLSFGYLGWKSQIANREDPDQIASSEAVWSGSAHAFLAAI